MTGFLRRRVVAVFRRKAAADVERRMSSTPARERTQSAEAERPLIGVGILDLAADVEADAAAKADAVDALEQLDGMRRRRAELLGQLVGRLPPSSASARTG